MKIEIKLDNPKYCLKGKKHCPLLNYHQMYGLHCFLNRPWIITDAKTQIKRPKECIEKYGV